MRTCAADLRVPLEEVGVAGNGLLEIGNGLLGLYLPLTQLGKALVCCIFPVGYRSRLA